jgi:hypothetical protein
VPEVAIEILFSIEKIKDIIEPIVFIDMHAFDIGNLGEAGIRGGILEYNPLFLSFLRRLESKLRVSETWIPGQARDDRSQ